MHEIEFDPVYNLSQKPGLVGQGYKKFIEEDASIGLTNPHASMENKNNAALQNTQCLQSQNYHLLSKKNILGIISYRQ